MGLLQEEAGQGSAFCSSRCIDPVESQPGELEELKQSLQLSRLTGPAVYDGRVELGSDQSQRR